MPPTCAKEAKFDCNQLERVLTLDEASTGLYMAYSNPTDDAVVQRTAPRSTNSRPTVPCAAFSSQALISCITLCPYCP